MICILILVLLIEILNKKADIDFCDATIDTFVEKRKEIITAKSEEQKPNTDDLSKSAIIK